MSAPGLQTGFGDPLGAETLRSIRAEGFTIVRLDCQQCSDVWTAALAQEAINEGLQPLVTVRRPEALRALPDGALAEFGNEPDLGSHFGWPTFESYWTPCREAIRIALELNLRLYIGVVSNLNNRGFDFLKKMPWNDIDPKICCSIHRYPERGKGPTAPHDRFKSREAEVAELRKIVGNRPLACTEVGYHRGAGSDGYTEEEIASHLAWERQFWTDQSFDFSVVYQINDGPAGDTSALGNYGLRRRDGTWRPAARAFTGATAAIEPPGVVEPPSPPAALKGKLVGFSIGGFYMCAAGGGGREVVADRPVMKLWETWTVDRLDAEHVSIQASDGHYLCAELDGTVIANRARLGEWERWKVHVNPDGRVAFESAHGKFLCAESGGGGPVVANRPAIGPWESFTPSNMDWWITLKMCRRPLVGPLRVQDKLLRDDTGFRRVHFDSQFDLLRTLRDEPERYTKLQDDCVDAGYQGRRVFLNVGGWMGFWDGHEVLATNVAKWYFDRNNGGHHRPAGYGTTLQRWPDYDDLFRHLLRDCLARGLRLHVTFGDCQIFFEHDTNGDQEVALTDHLARIAAEEGGSKVIAFWETTNEVPINRRGGTSPQAIDHMGRLIRTVKQHLPDVLCGMGAFLSEEPDQLYASITYGDVCFVHVTRSPEEMCLKRTHALTHWEGDWRHFPVPYDEGEPAGPNIGPMDGQGDDMYQPISDPAMLLALYAMHALLGHVSTWFDGGAVRSTADSTLAWGYDEIPRILVDTLPEDIATWANASNGRGGIAYFFKGKDFRTAMYATWDTSPPQPIAEWTLYTGTGVTKGTGTPPRSTGYLVGRFA